ncbi:MAG: hypothetical protein NC222_06690 [Staphylococcus sp.]|nr:hypothetical protein [Staphylococcus sp.]
MLEKRNNMLEIKTPLYMNAADIDLAAFINKAVADFEYRVLALYRLATNSEKPVTGNELERKKFVKKSIGNIWLYDAWYGAEDFIDSNYKIYTFKINPKSINFETLLTDLKDRLATTVHIDDGSAGFSVDEKAIVCLTDIPKWGGLFGGGEFPFMKIYCFRLGNNEYFCYNITR